MSIPTVFSPVQPQDFTLKPIQVHKKFIIQRSDLYSGSVPNTGSGYKLWEARYLGEKMKLGSNTSYPTNSFDGTYKHIIWSSIDSQYYRFPYDKYATLEHSNPRFTYKFLNISASIISIPQLDFGESIKPGSIEITGSGYFLKDDGNGNLYDVNINTSSFSPVKNLIAHWEFNNEFRGLKLPETYWQHGNRNLQYKSKIFTPHPPSRCRNLQLSTQFDVFGKEIGLSGVFVSSSIMTDNRQEFNFTKNDDFTISFWTYFVDFENTGSLITKRGTIKKQTFGNQNKYNQNDLLVQTENISSSYIDQSTNVYPYDFQLYGIDTIRFKRADGINSVTLNLNTAANNDSWIHVGLVKSGSNYYMYQNGILQSSASNSSLGNCVNDHCLMFGSLNQALQQPFSGFLNELRFYDIGLTTTQIQTLASGSTLTVHQTPIIGNVFYKNGTIVIGGHSSIYSDIINSAFTLKFRSTHTIYQYEILCRIKKGSFNLSQNPTARQNPYTDLILNEMTGSLSQGALFPYATSIGLYNDKGEMMAVAKLNQALQMRDDVDISILIRMDV